MFFLLFKNNAYKLINNEHFAVYLSMKTFFLSRLIHLVLCQINANQFDVLLMSIYLTFFLFKP